MFTVHLEVVVVYFIIWKIKLTQAFKYQGKQSKGSQPSLYLSTVLHPPVQSLHLLSQRDELRARASL